MSAPLLQIGLKGTFELSTPYSVLVKANVEYTCIAIRKFEDIVAEGGDPYELYYKNAGLSLQSFKDDVAVAANVITIQASDGSVIHVPDTYVISMPNQGGVPYHVLALGVTLAALPDKTDLSYLKDRVQDLVRDTLGVESTVREVAISALLSISKEEHENIEAARRALITASRTDFAQLVEMTRQRDAGLQKIAQLEAYIRDNLIPPTP